MTKVNILQQNAGDLSIQKMTEIKKIMADREMYILLINEANITSDNVQYYNIRGYSIYTLLKARQIVNGVLVAVNVGFVSIVL